MPQPGEVFYSERSGQFYQGGRRGALSRESASAFIEYNPRLDRYVDNRGRFVPNEKLLPPETQVRRFVARDVQGRPFLSTEFRDKVITQEQMTQADYKGNQMAVVRTVVRTADGKVHISYAATKLGRTPNVQGLELQSRKKIAAELRDEGYDVSTHQIGNLTAAVTYVQRTVRVVKRGD